MASALNEDSVEKKLRNVSNTQDSIQTLSLWIIHHKTNHAKIVELWMKVLRKTVHPSHRLTLLYLCNDVVQTCKRKKAYVYNTTFKEYLKEAASLVRDHSVKSKVERIFNIWGERGVYDAAFVKSLRAILNGQSLKSSKIRKKLEDEAINTHASPVNTPPVQFESKVVPAEPQHRNMTERDEEESARILAEFKPHEMIDQITAFRRQEVEIHLKVSQLSHLKLDASSLEAVKQLKDRAHGNDFSSQFEDSCTKLEDLVKRQARHVEEQYALIETLSLSETFYEEQYREAKIVANAYKNFGARINNMKKKLDELKKSFPEPDSPIPSPDINAPSPSNTPPHVGGIGGYGYSPAAPINYGQGLTQKVWTYNGTSSMLDNSVMNSITSEDNDDESPPLEAPSPEGSPPDLNLDGTDNVSGSLESRLASFFDRNRSDTSNPPVYTPQLSHSVASSKKLKLGDDDGSTTPLNDEAPTTPVQDENFISPPKRNTPPKKENPIDFLSRLISQTQKVPAKTGQPSFLDTLSLLTPVSKKSESDSHQQSLNPQSWAAWKGKTNENSTSPVQPSSPLPYGPANSILTPGTLFPLQMAPPPIPMPVPPPPVPVSLAMGLTMPPPPPPPFGLSSVLPPNFSKPPPGFQQTSPGQKENWPDIKLNPAADSTNSRGSTHNSVLKELAPADVPEAKLIPQLSKESSSSSALIDPDAMEIVSDEEEEEDDNDVLGLESDDDEAVGDAKAEFAQKLKQKTSQGAVKSHVFVPNRERPNLMTLTVSDDLDEEEMIDDDTVVEDTWSEKSRQKSRSRSRSREKDKSHKHKKKKHKRNHSSSDEDSRLSDEDRDEGKGTPGLSSVVKKIDTSTRRNSRDSNKGEKHEERKFEKYDNNERKYDRYDERGYVGRVDYRPYKDYRGPKETDQAYTQAYRNAFFQQYSLGRFNPFPPVPPPPMDPRRTGYGKY